jgi:hypothetical protein
MLIKCPCRMHLHGPVLVCCSCVSSAGSKWSGGPGGGRVRMESTSLLVREALLSAGRHRGPNMSGIFDQMIIVGESSHQLMGSTGGTACLFTSFRRDVSI